MTTPRSTVCGVLLVIAALCSACSSRTTSPSAADGTTTGGATDTDFDPVAASCEDDEYLGELTRRGCLGSLDLQCQHATSEAECDGRWSSAELDVLAPLEVACRWHPDAVLVRAVGDECEVLERTARCLAVVVTNDPDDPVGDPRCEPFGPLTCDGGVQSGRPHESRVSNTDAWLVAPVECGAILGFETDAGRCQGEAPYAACGCFCE